MPYYRSNKTGEIFQMKKPGKYKHHVGAKEQAKAAKRQAAAEAKKLRDEKQA